MKVFRPLRFGQVYYVVKKTKTKPKYPLIDLQSRPYRDNDRNFAYNVKFCSGASSRSVAV